MYILEYKQLYIVPTEMTKNRTCQSYRWKQYAVCEDRTPLEEIMRSKEHQTNWRISELAV